MVDIPILKAVAVECPQYFHILRNVWDALLFKTNSVLKILFDLKFALFYCPIGVVRAMKN